MTPIGNLVEIKNLRMYFPVLSGLLQRKTGEIRAVDGVSLGIKKGETFGLVGESGSGKTTLGRCILQMYRPTSGEVYFDGEELTRLKGERLRRLRRRMQIIFQDPYASLDPRMKCRDIVGEPLRVHKVARGKEYERRVAEALELVELDASMMNRYPHEFSGGQRQRISIARAIVLRPEFIVCDEPVSALDVSIQAQIIALLERLKEELSLTYLFISHDLAVVRNIADEVAVMYVGKIVEITDSDELYRNPLHPYTQALLSAAPVPDPVVESQRRRIVLSGNIPSPLNPPTGCRFHPRCPQVRAMCREVEPELRSLGGGHQVACHLYSAT